MATRHSSSPVSPSSIARNSGKYDHLMKLMLIGDSGVGKSCLLIRFSEDTFTHSFISTVGIDFKIRTMNVDDKDTAGQERFRSITSSYYRGSHGILLVYDVTDERSFSNIMTWILGMPVRETESASKLLIGNKADMEDKRVVPMHKGQSLAQELGFRFVETSAKANLNVELAFLTIVQEIKTKLEQNKLATEKPVSPVVDISSATKEEKCMC